MQKLWWFNLFSYVKKIRGTYFTNAPRIWFSHECATPVPRSSSGRIDVEVKVLDFQVRTPAAKEYP